MTRMDAILATLIGYKLVLIAIGVLAATKTHDTADFFLGGRRLGPFVAALSASASSSSAWTLLGVSGAAWAWGLGAIWLFPACVGGFVLNWTLIAPALRRLSHERGALTATELIVGAPGAPLRRTLSTLAAAIILFSFTFYVAAQFQGAGKTFHETFGLAPDSSILLGAAVVVLYTLLGGFWAVSLSDAVQGMAMVIASVALPIAALLAVGGPGGLADGLAGVKVEGFLSLTRNLPPAAAVGFVVGILGIGLGYPGQPHVVNRFMALRDDPGALVRARRIAVGWAVVVYAGMLLVGWCGRILYPALADKELVFVTATNDLFHPVVAGVMLAAVLSAIMSTADSQLLVAGSAVTHDLGLGRGSERWRLAISRAVVLAVSGAAVATALWGSQAIFDRVLFAWSAIGCAFGPLLVLIALGRTPRPAVSLVAMVVGFAGAVLAYSQPETKGTWVERVAPFAVALLIAALGTARRPVNARP